MEVSGFICQLPNKGYTYTSVFDSEGKAFTPSEEFDIPLLMYSNKESSEHIFTTHEGGMTEEMIMEVFKEMGVNND